MVVKGHGNEFKDAVKAGKAPLTTRLEAALAEFEEFVKKRDEEQQVFEDKVNEIRSQIADYDQAIKGIG